MINPTYTIKYRNILRNKKHLIIQYLNKKEIRLFYLRTNPVVLYYLHIVTHVWCNISKSVIVGNDYLPLNMLPGLTTNKGDNR